MFINDVLFHAAELVALIQTPFDYDQVCALDFAPDSIDLWFYDIWVARDANGEKMRNRYPYAVVPESVKRMEAGLPFAVYTCWNGVTVFRAEPFFRGLRFRNPRDTGQECLHGEAYQMSEDLHYMGYHKIAINPVMRVAYNLETFLRTRWLETEQTKRYHSWPLHTHILPDYFPEPHGCLPVEPEWPGPPIEYTCCDADGTGLKAKWHECHKRTYQPIDLEFLLNN